MNKIGLALRELYRAEEELADEYTKVGERLVAEREIWYACKRFKAAPQALGAGVPLETSGAR